jgi:hypothetical protein
VSEQGRFRLGEFWLARRSDGATQTWQITWFDRARRQTRQRSTGTEDIELAKRRLAEHYVARGERRQEPAASVLLDQVLTRYYEAYAKSLPSCDVAAYAIDHWRRFWKDATVAQLSLDRIEEFKVWLATGIDKPMKPATINRVLAVGRAALERAKKRRELDSSPFIEGVAVPRQRLYRMTPGDMARLLNASSPLPWVQRWLVGSIVTLGRPEAVLQLSRPQLDFDLRRIDMNAPGRAQNDKHRPVVPMIETAHQWLDGAWTGLWITYPTKKGPRPIASIRMGFERARDRAGLPQTITPYSIRRTLSTELRRRGVAPWEIAGYLGHSVREFAMTEEYAIYAPDYLSHAGRTIDAYCAELQPALDFELLRTSCVPGAAEAEAQVVETGGRRDWDRTSDHFHVNVALPSKIHKLKGA